MTEQSVRARLRTFILKHGTQRAAAAAMGVSPTYLHLVIRGKTEPGPKILSVLGLRRIKTRVTRYEEVA